MTVDTTKYPIIIEAIKILKMIESYGAEAVIAGGAVRDLVMGNVPHDVDIATNMGMDQLEKLFPCHDIGKSKDFGLVVAKSGDFTFEIAHYRKDGEYSDGRRPDSVELVSTFKDDAARRDFTINAMGLTSGGEILDFFGGLEDIRNGVICAVGDPIKRFQEDHLRMLRAIRFSTRFSFEISKETKDGIVKMAPCIKSVSSERIRDELCKMTIINFDVAVADMYSLGILRHILPEVSGLRSVDQKDLVRNLHMEGSVLIHTVFAMYHSPNTPLAQFAALFHDLGKVSTRTVNESGHVQFLEHEIKSVEITERVMKRLKFDNDMIQKVITLVKNHMRFHSTGAKSSVSMIRRAIRDIGVDLIVPLLDLAEADCKACLPVDNYVPELRVKVQKVIDSPIPVRRKAVLSGNEIMEVVKLPPGPQIGRFQNMLIELEDAMAEKDEVLTKEIAIRELKRFKFF